MRTSSPLTVVTQVHIIIHPLYTNAKLLNFSALSQGMYAQWSGSWCIQISANSTITIISALGSSSGAHFSCLLGCISG